MHDVLFDEIIHAASAEDFFGDTRTKDEIDVRYRAFARLVHPDRAPEAIRDRATAAFTKLNELRRIAHYKLDQGTFGDRSAASAPPAAKPPTIIETKARKYVVTKQIGQTEIADLYKTEDNLVLKVPRSAKDNDLMEAEFEALSSLYSDSANEDGFYRYLPRFLNSFLLGPKRRRVIVTPHYPEYYSMLEVYKAKDALDDRDAVWMVKRVLEVLGFIHEKGFVHGAIVPTSVLVHPVHHGIRLVDWSYAVPTGKPMKAIPRTWRSLYPPEVLRKEPATAATDIYMTAMLFAFATGGNLSTGKLTAKVPAEIDRFFGTCLFAAPSRRPHNAWDVREEFGDLLKGIVGKPSYRRLDMGGK